jgi:hypothetical protein
MVLLFLLIVSILANVAFAYLYYFKIEPNAKSLQSQLTELKITPSPSAGGFKVLPTCTSQEKRMWSVSTQNYVCIPYTKSEALSECSSDTGQLLSDILKKAGSESISELDKARNFAMKICMENKGFEY